mmetsp:Transcript_14702/g.21687  ORF Transcript_14702/g.21687 Transcript_14702/m.21687 type:complete len:378 (+) Transcript_14702:103-1236(+)|eukprot:CAMPEP_0194250176 /NCGR_PEP_ID=MMETSP0158-20130606/22341_1 /TAXON_ID=33649 /ORGANISM="Thalassionema nitzschioides, Strain L26-B" /LENGTH=377 /DNA_ID=CAMNT_0038986883 /DNA_START=93 /DNA_END=1226 /DNA_ORIENTATION=-
MVVKVLRDNSLSRTRNKFAKASFAVALMFAFFSCSTVQQLRTESYRDTSIRPVELENLAIAEKNGREREVLSTCCFRSKVNLTEKLTAEFFEDKREIHMEEWKNISSSVLINPETSYCEKEWQKMILGSFLPVSREGLLLQRYFGILLRRTYDQGNMRYVPDDPALPRVLLLGDSISQNIMGYGILGYSRSPEYTQFIRDLFHGTANMHVLYNNCYDFENYREQLVQVWLGDCPWDVIQFNVGHHFHEEKNETSTEMSTRYHDNLIWVIEQLRTHSPGASIVLALSTPSPFDSIDTYPNETHCSYFHKFHKAGFISKLNDIARRVASRSNVMINDRYQAILPFVGQYQRDCDIHYKDDGNKLLAKNDLGVISKALLK